MGACSEDPHLCGASWLLRFTSLLLSVCSAVTQSPGARESAVDDSGIPVTLKRIQGTSVLFHVVRNPELSSGAELENMSWGIVSRSKYIVMLHVFPGRDVPQWANFQDKLENRVHVPNETSLQIDNLTLEDSGLYRARVRLTTGIQHDQDFNLTVYGQPETAHSQTPGSSSEPPRMEENSEESVPPPQIWTSILSVTQGWCNVIAECNTTGTREDLLVSWESQGLPRELEQRPVPGPSPNPWTLAVNLPLSQPSPSLTCVVSNQVDQRTATLDLGDICSLDAQGQTSAAHLPGILASVAVLLLLILGAGIYLWKRRGKKKNVEPGRGTGSQEEPRDHDGGSHYAELSQQESGDQRDKGRGEPHLEEENSLTTVYSEVHRPGQDMTVI